MMTSVALVIGIPFVSAAVLVLVPGYRVSAAGNVLAMFATFLAGVSLLFVDAGASSYFIVDDMNILFIILNTLVGLTTSVFSASYIGHEIETGKLTPLFVRFYHAMFLGMMGSMNV
ncbi:MAG: hydrogenase 4 subunit F, partial [Aestuariivirga sp.]